MPSVLVLGFDPQVVPGVDAAAFHTVLDNELVRFGERGVDASMALLEMDGSAEPTAAEALAAHAWDVVVIGGGIRKPEQLLTFFEKIVNLVREHAPQAAIAFNTSGGTSVEAAERWL
ncbi:hypothetical protein ACFU99_25105 [Streptomyces sp. NPDC057654]|uniref:hypothetical protein n=1 Tax=Streptomyces sp. NPDC057654 TaxID=3346196 RepID=UPI0036B24494